MKEATTTCEKAKDAEVLRCRRLAHFKSRTLLQNEFCLLAMSLGININEGKKIDRSKMVILCKALKSIKKLEEKILKFYHKLDPNSEAVSSFIADMQNNFTTIMKTQKLKNRMDKALANRTRRTQKPNNVLQKLEVQQKELGPNIVFLKPSLNTDNVKKLSDLQCVSPSVTDISEKDSYDIVEPELTTKFSKKVLLHTEKKVLRPTEQTPKKASKENIDPLKKKRKKKTKIDKVFNSSKCNQDAKLCPSKRAKLHMIPLIENSQSCRKQLHYYCNAKTTNAEHSYSLNNIELLSKKMKCGPKPKAMCSKQSAKSFNYEFSGMRSFHFKSNPIDKVFQLEKRKRKSKHNKDKENIDPKQPKRSRCKASNSRRKNKKQDIISKYCKVPLSKKNCNTSVGNALLPISPNSSQSGHCEDLFAFYDNCTAICDGPSDDICETTTIGSQNLAATSGAEAPSSSESQCDDFNLFCASHENSPNNVFADNIDLDLLEEDLVDQQAGFADHEESVNSYGNFSDALVPDVDGSIFNSGFDKFNIDQIVRTYIGNCPIPIEIDFFE